MAELDPFGVIGGGTATAAPTNYSGGSAKSNAGRTYDPFNINSVTPIANPNPIPKFQPIKQSMAAKPQTTIQKAGGLLKNLAVGTKNFAESGVKSAYDIGRGAAASGSIPGTKENPTALANAHAAKAKDFPAFGGTFYRPLVQAAESIVHPASQHSFTPTSPDEQEILGKQPIQNINKGVNSTYQAQKAKGKSTFKSSLMAGLYGGGQVAQDALVVGGLKAGGVVDDVANNVNKVKTVVKTATGKNEAVNTALQTAKQNSLLDKARTSNTKDAELPEDHTKYFNVTSDTKTVPLDKLTSSKTPEENVKGGTNAVGIMQKVSKGEVPKRNPITVSKQADGTYKVLDGNGTLTAAQAHNWQSLPVHVVDEGQHTAAQDLNTRATAANDDFHSGAQKVAKAYGLNYKAGPVKGTDRILEKAVNHYGGDVSKVRDSVRGTIPIANPAAADDYVKALSKEFEVTRVKDGYKDPRSGYKDIKVNVKTKDGHEGEIILATPEMLTAKDQQGGHELYNISRDPRRPLAEQQLAEQKGNALYDKAQAATNKRLASGSDLPYSDSKTLSASAGDTSEASLRAPLPKTRETPVKTLVSDTLPSGKERTAKTTSSLVTKNLRESSISSTIADESKNVKDESANGKVEQGTSKVAERIAKDIKGQYGDLAQYDKISIKDQAQKAATLLSDRAKLDKVVSGEDPLPQGLRATSVITAVRSDPVLSKDSELLRQLAGSDLASESSYSAQELRLTRENAKLDPVEAIKGVQKARATALETKTGKSAAKAVSTEVKQIRATVPKVSRQSWGDFIESIKC